MWASWTKDVPNAPSTRSANAQGKAKSGALTQGGQRNRLQTRELPFNFCWVRAYFKSIITWYAKLLAFMSALQHIEEGVRPGQLVATRYAIKRPYYIQRKITTLFACLSSARRQLAPAEWYNGRVVSADYRYNWKQGRLESLEQTRDRTAFLSRYLQSSCVPRIAAMPVMIGSPFASRVGTNVSPRTPWASRLTCVEQLVGAVWIKSSYSSWSGVDAELLHGCIPYPHMLRACAFGSNFPTVLR